jgi:putative resolvase
MKIYKITEASEYLGVSINALKTLPNNGKVKSFNTTGKHRRFRHEDLDAYTGVEKDKQEKLTVIYARCSTAKQKENLER